MKKLLIILTYFIFFGCASTNNCIDESKKDPDVVCFQVYEPVCGCDGQTYSNSCEADKAGVTEYTAGECNEEE
jgi:hypothetical protein